MAGRMRRIKQLSTFRKIALADWRDPNDPTVYGTLDVDATPMLAYIERVRSQRDVRLTVTHLVGRAVARAIALHPEINCRISWGRLLQRDTVDIFFQVATEGGVDLSGAKVERVDQLSAVELAEQLSRKAQQIRERKDPQFEMMRQLMQRMPIPLVRGVMGLSTLLVNDLDLDLTRFGLPRDPFGSAMVTNVGSFDLEMGFAPLVPMSKVPVLVLVGGVRKRPAVVDDQVVVQPRLNLCATFDHRVMDGFQAGQLARVLKAYLASPEAFEPAG
jgi:pyruvate/2-oxoglutarate dehydrogenase complex dihydrolipoamide acyltransferase (E2) component